MFPLLSLAEEVKSPNGVLKAKFYVSEGKMTYELFFHEKVIVKPSHLGLEFINWPSMMEDFEMGEVEYSSFDETWKPVWGETSSIRNHYNEMKVTVRQQSTNRHLIIRLRIFNEGLGLRYEFPRQEGLDNVKIKEEHTEFAMTGDHTAYWIPGDYDTDEYEYSISRLSEIRNLEEKARTENAFENEFLIVKREMHT